jgi:hypothetical protein
MLIDVSYLIVALYFNSNECVNTKQRQDIASAGLSADLQPRWAGLEPTRRSGASGVVRLRPS